MCLLSLLQDGFCQQTFNRPIVRVDPEGRAAAMLIYGKHLVILPFRRDSGLDDPLSDAVPGTGLVAKC